MTAHPERKKPDMTITPDTFKPYGDYDEYGGGDDVILEAEVDGVAYLTDRHLLIRADLVAPRPAADHMWKMRPKDTQAVVDFVAMVLKAEPVPEPGLPRKLAPVYVADLEGTGLSLVPSARVWLIQQDGLTVGCIAPLTDRGGFDGILPGEIQQIHRKIFEIIRPSSFDRWHAWNTAFEVVAAVKAAA